MKKDLLIVGMLVGLAGLAIGVVVVLQAMQPEDERGKTIAPNTDPIAHVHKRDEKKTPPAPTPRKSETRPEEKKTPDEKKTASPPQEKVEIKAETKKEIEPKKEVKIEPKAEVKIEPRKDDNKPAAAKVIVLGNDIKLNDPDGEYAIKTINGGERIVVQGKIKTLTIAGLNDKSTLDATLLDAGEIIFTDNLNSGATVLLGTARALKLRDINDQSTLEASTLGAHSIVLTGAVNSGSAVKLHAPNGSVEILGEINDRARIEIAAPGGKVRFNAAINGEARLAITARDVEFRSAINGAKTQLDITLTKAGSLQFTRLNGGVRLHYRKADAGDPEPRIGAGVVDERADFRHMPPLKK